VSSRRDSGGSERESASEGRSPGLDNKADSSLETRSTWDKVKVPQLVQDEGPSYKAVQTP
jgi:hypothetical protein